MDHYVDGLVSQPYGIQVNEVVMAFQLHAATRPKKR